MDEPMDMPNRHMRRVLKKKAPQAVRDAVKDLEQFGVKQNPFTAPHRKSPEKATIVLDKIMLSSVDPVGAMECRGEGNSEVTVRNTEQDEKVYESREDKAMSETKSDDTSAVAEMHNLTEEIQKEDAKNNKNEELVRLLASFIGIDCRNPIWDDEHLPSNVCWHIAEIRKGKLSERDWIIKNSESFRKMIEAYQSAFVWASVEIPEISKLDGQKIGSDIIEKIETLLKNISDQKSALERLSLNKPTTAAEWAQLSENISKANAGNQDDVNELRKAVETLPRKEEPASEGKKAEGVPKAQESAELIKENKQLKEDNDQLYSDLDKADKEIAALNQKIEGMSNHLEHKSSKPVPAGEMSNEVRNSVAQLLLNNRDKYKDFQIDNLEQCLIILKEFLGDRVEILGSAFISARKACTFEQPEKAFELMLRLVIDYRDALPGKGTSVAKKVFNDSEWAADETDSVDDKKRTFGGNVMREHLRIGNNEGSEKGWRCHFCYDHKSQKIIIGHCGKHLDFK